MTTPAHRFRCDRMMAWALIVGAAISTAGCATPTRLDDATLGTVRLATSEDMAMLAQARDHSYRESFGGAAINDPEKGLIVFEKADYDAYQAYKREHAEPTRSAGVPVPPDWPVLRISFLTRRPLSPALGSLYFCDTGRRMGVPDVLWNGRFFGDAAADIENALQTSPQPQEYVIIAAYTHHEEENWSTVDAVTLMPPPGDLCFAFFELGYPTVYGEPLRIDKEAVAEALGTLPRQLPVPPQG